MEKLHSHVSMIIGDEAVFFIKNYYMHQATQENRMVIVHPFCYTLLDAIRETHMEVGSSRANIR